MEHLAPLLQTVLWVGLWVALFVRYHKQVENVLEALHKRIQRGSKVKVGPFELSEEVKPQDQQQQLEKLDQEVAQVIAEDASTTEPEVRSQVTSSIQLEALLAEDLSLREIQDEFGAPINRQIQISNAPFDGFFVKDGGANIVEVKLANRTFNTSILEKSLEALRNTVRLYHWRRVKFIFVVVYRSKDANLATEKQRLQNALAGYDATVEVRCYYLSDLAQKWKGREPAR